MYNPYEGLFAKLNNIESLLIDIKHGKVSVPAVQVEPKPGTATRTQAAGHLNISLPTLAEYTKSGKIQGQRIGRRVLYRWADLDAALTAIKTGGK